MMEDRFLKRLRKKAKKGLRGWPIAAIAFYGPNLSQATKVTVGIVPSENAEVKELRDDPHWAVVSPDRMRGEATFHPICRGVVLGDTESGRSWRWNEDPLSLFSNGFAPSCHHVGRQYTEYALAILQDDAVEIDEVPDAVGHLVRCAGDARTPKAVSDQNDVV